MGRTARQTPCPCRHDTKASAVHGPSACPMTRHEHDTTRGPARWTARPASTPSHPRLARHIKASTNPNRLTLIHSPTPAAAALASRSRLSLSLTHSLSQSWSNPPLARRRSLWARRPVGPAPALVTSTPRRPLVLPLLPPFPFRRSGLPSSSSPPPPVYQHGTVKMAMAHGRHGTENPAHVPCCGPMTWTMARSGTARPARCSAVSARHGVPACRADTTGWPCIVYVFHLSVSNGKMFYFF